MGSEGVITALEIQKRNSERVNLFIDGEFAFGISALEAAHLHKGQTLTGDDIAQLRAEDAVIQAVDRGARFLAYRPRSTQEVRRNLEGKNIPAAVVETAIQRLSTLGYLDDRAFARYWVENRNAFKPLGARALRYELRQKGVTPAIIDQVLNDMTDEAEAAYQAACSKARSLRGKTQTEFKLKLGAFLQRRGFGFDVIGDVAHRLIGEMAAEDPDYFAHEEED